MRKIENDSKGNERVAFTAKLLSVSSNELQNVNGTKYRVCNVEFTDANGRIQKASGIVYAGNYQHGMVAGKEYAATATNTKEGWLIAVSHLEPNADRPTNDMFVTETVATLAGKVNVATGEIAS